MKKTQYSGLIIIFLIIVVTKAVSQEKLFDITTVSPRNLALGGVGIATQFGPDNFFYNPGVIPDTNRFQMSMGLRVFGGMHTSNVADVYDEIEAAYWVYMPHFSPTHASIFSFLSIGELFIGLGIGYRMYWDQSLNGRSIVKFDPEKSVLSDSHEIRRRSGGYYGSIIALNLGFRDKVAIGISYNWNPKSRFKLRGSRADQDDYYYLYRRTQSVEFYQFGLQIKPFRRLIIGAAYTPAWVSQHEIVKNAKYELIDDKWIEYDTGPYFGWETTFPPIAGLGLSVGLTEKYWLYFECQTREWTNSKIVYPEYQLELGSRDGYAIGVGIERKTVVPLRVGYARRIYPVVTLEEASDPIWHSISIGSCCTFHGVILDYSAEYCLAPHRYMERKSMEQVIRLSLAASYSI